MSAPPATDMSYLAYQVLQLAVLQNETAAIVVARAATYLDWINKNV